MQHYMTAKRAPFIFTALFAASLPGVLIACNDFTISMHDSYGDGWNQNHWMFYTTDGKGSYRTGTLHSGYDGDATVCLVDDCYVFVVDGGEWDEEISWEFDDEYDDEIALNGTAPFVTYFCAQDGKIYESDERPYHNSTWEILYGHTNEGDGYFGAKADCYVDMQIENVTQETSIQKDDRTPHWAETLPFHTCSLDSEYYYMQMLDSDRDETDNADDLILGPWFATLAYMKGHQIHNNDQPVTWMLYDADGEYIFFTADIFDCADTYHMPPSALPTPVPSVYPTLPMPTTETPRPTVSPTTSTPTTSPTLMPSVAVKSLTIKRPVAGTTFYAGQTHNVTWSYTGAIGWVSLFLFQNDEYHSKIAFMVEYSSNSTCDPHMTVDDDDSNCVPIQEKFHGGHYDDSYAWTLPSDLEHDSTYQIEAFSSQGQYAISDYFTIISTPTAAPTSAPDGSGSGNANDAGLDTETEVAISSVSAIVGAAAMACCFMSYRSYKTRGRPTAWLYDTHISMAGQEDRAAVEMGTITTPMGGGIEADVVMGGPVHQATAAEVSIATAVPMGPAGGKGTDPGQVREVEATVVGAAEEVPRNNNVLQVSTKGAEEAQL